ncbi:hypothetical protein GGI16_009085 [Coemansia sp. S142-1]|nr:hypothetical protein GGI16_009085 [Coemansia sp. S142-1]
MLDLGHLQAHFDPSSLHDCATCLHYCASHAHHNHGYIHQLDIEEYQARLEHLCSLVYVDNYGSVPHAHLPNSHEHCSDPPDHFRAHYSPLNSRWTRDKDKD